MARAKRTDRAEARRRHRAVSVEAASTEAEASSAKSPARASSAAPGAAATPARPGFLGAFRLAARPVNLRDDIQALPEIAIKSKALWVPGLLVLVSAGSVAIVGLGRNTLVDVLFQIALITPAMVPAFLSGMMAPRAGYLTGGLIGLLSGVLSSILVAGGLSGPSTNGTAAPVVPPNGLVTYVLYAVVLGTVFSAGVGGFASFYRRFLQLTSPNYGRTRPRTTKPAARRR